MMVIVSGSQLENHDLEEQGLKRVCFTSVHVLWTLVRARLVRGDKIENRLRAGGPV